MAERRKQSPSEELANTTSHAIGFVLVGVAGSMLISAAADRGDPAMLVGTCVFSGTMALLFLTSSVYHLLSAGRAKRVFRLLDHAAIYLLIAGTYTPFALGVLRGPLGWSLLGLIWGLALVGIVTKALGALRFPKLSAALYIAMGWLALIAVKPLWEALPGWGFFCLVAGGVLYTSGVAFYAATHVRYAHFIWHLFVLAGTACHVLAVASSFA